MVGSWAQDVFGGGRTRRATLRLVLALALACSTLVLVTPPKAEAVLIGLPTGFVDEQVVGGLPYPTAIAFTPDDTMFVALKSGVVRVQREGQLLPTPFVDISTRVHDNHDRGLLGLAIHPDFPQAPYVYLLYTHDPVGATPDQASPVAGRVAQLLRVEADAATGYVTAKPGTEVVLLGGNSTLANIGQEDDGRNTAFASCMTGRTMAGAPVEDCIPSDENSHTIGSLVFGPDKTLFVSSGDGSNYGGVDPRALRALNKDSLAGKVLRIDPISGEGIPDNPFFDPQAPDRNLSKVWAYGLRNPFRMTVDQATGNAYVGDVGWNTWEEINTGKGANFGWPCYEGGAVSGAESGTTTSHQQGSYRTNTATAAACNALYAQGVSAVRAPTFAYDHSAGGASANAGTVYEGDTYPAEYDGALFIADYNRRWIRYLTFDVQGRASVHPFGQENTGSGPVQVITGPDKNLYWMRYNSTGGEVRRVRYVAGGNTPPVAIVQADVTIGLTPLTVQFNSNDSYDPDAQALTYSWDFGDGGTSAERNPTHTFTQPGVYDAALTLTETTAPFASSSESVRITVGNNPPLASITSPTDGTSYAIGDVLDFTGEASAGGSPLPASAMTWEVRQLHNEHVHYSTPVSAPQPGNPNVSTMSLTIDDHGDDSRYQVCLTATVAPQQTDTQCIDLFPRKTPYTIATEPVGFKVNYQDEGLELSGPAIIEPIVGSVQTLSVDPVQQSRSFSRWSDGVTAQQRSFTTGVSPQTFTAIFENRLPTARITADATSGQAPASFSFDGSASSDPEGDVLEFAWTDGRGGTSTSPTPTFSYPDPGTYDVQLTVTDQLGGTATAQVQVTVTPVPNRAPTAVIQTSTTSGPAPLAVDVSGAGSSDPDGDVLTYLWNYGDGATSTLADPPAHTYTTAGTYQLSLTVDDGRGLTGTSSVAITVGPSTPLPSGLVLGLGFDEGSGSSVLDVSGRGNNGTIAGATWTAGRYGQALSFDGTNDMVTVADAASLDFTQAFTISAWVRPAASSGGYRTVLIKERPRQLVYALYSSTNGASSPPGIYAAKGSSDRGARGGAVLPTGQWSHVAGTWDGATLRLYVNGTLRASTALGGTLPNSAGALRIGGNTVWNEWFAGAIDEVRAYNRTLTPTEITTIKDRPVNG